ncbi:MAG: hypothetical protein PHN90_12720 [Methanothrix sp.]|jgi:hypothetical protein|nr:hypothetical protein [Methanothrix sp.]
MAFDPDKIPEFNYIPVKFPEPYKSDLKAPEPIRFFADIEPILNEISNELKEQTKLLNEILKVLKTR